MIHLFDSYSFVSTLVLALATYVMSFQKLFKVRNERKKKKKENFYKVLDEGLEMETIASLDDIYNLYKGTNNLTLENDNYRFRLNELLREYLVKLHTNDGEKLSKEKIKEWKDKIDRFIKENEELSPFSELPQADRNIMNDIVAFLEKDDKKSIMRKLDEMSTSIQIRKEYLERIEKQNKWSVPVSIVGLIFTIFFGILSFI
ncbi:hypothetical protein [Thalassobacillus pellis]|uniref:hypothetical protein n=1 Tax=Thalassobacillus pellis TaxID=748008 RepID=UPI001960E946|nr:hypothetical protein [Thalassobacillus pellis]MBM7551234.1 hypothetical protein [Thalassobacillus pellis]